MTLRGWRAVKPINQSTYLKPLFEALKFIYIVKIIQIHMDAVQVYIWTS